MGVPDFQSFFKPLLELAADGEEQSMGGSGTAGLASMLIQKLAHSEHLINVLCSSIHSETSTIPINGVLVSNLKHRISVASANGGYFC